MSSYRTLVMAKAPVAGRVKTRLGAVVGDDAAARLASAALLDTLEACTEAVGAEHCVLALDGDLATAVDADALRAALVGWSVTPQQGDGFAARLAHAHREAGDGVVVQVGMDTPQVSAALLDAAAAPLLCAPGSDVDVDAVLGPALDGGWWVLARRGARVADALAHVEMSTDHTGADTRAALEAAGWRVAPCDALRDVDEVDDADRAAADAPHTRFARAWRETSPTVTAGGPR